MNSDQPSNAEEILFTQVSDGLVRCTRSGVELAVLIRRQGNWDLKVNKGRTIATGLLGTMKAFTRYRYSVEESTNV